MFSSKFLITSNQLHNCVRFVYKWDGGKPNSRYAEMQCITRFLIRLDFTIKLESRFSIQPQQIHNGIDSTTNEQTLLLTALHYLQ